MNTTHSPEIMQRWSAIQCELIPLMHDHCGGSTPVLEKLIRTLEWSRIEEFVKHSWSGMGRPPCDRGALANAFVAKAALNLPTNAALVERLTVDRALRRICGFDVRQALVPSESSFSRAFAEFADAQLAERVHEAFIKTSLGQRIIGHISRDGTAIEAREKAAVYVVPEASAKSGVRRGRPRKGEARPPAPTGKIEAQRQQSLSALRAAMPTACDRGTKCNAQGYKNSWKGYKLHIDTACNGMPISAVLSSASMHDSLAAIALSRITNQRVTYCYELMDAAYCSEALRSDSQEHGHVPLIDHNPRKGVKIDFAPHEAERYKARSGAERTNARLKDEFGARHLRVRGATKVMSHLMFGVLALALDQWMRLLI